MEDLSPLFFLAIFQLLGGAAFGAGLRSMLKRDFGSIFLLVWGGGFGGIPAIMGYFMFASGKAPWAAWIGPAVFVGMALFVIFFAMPMGGIFGGGPTLGFLLGGALMLGGAVTGYTQFNRANPATLLLGGGLFLAGCVIVALAANAVLRINDK